MLAVVFFAVTGIAHANLGGATQRVTSVKDAGTGAIQVAFQYDGHGNVYRRTQGTLAPVAPRPRSTTSRSAAR